MLYYSIIYYILYIIYNILYIIYYLLYYITLYYILLIYIYISKHKHHNETWFITGSLNTNIITFPRANQ